MKKGILKKIAAGLALMMLIALAPGMGLADDLPNYYTITYHPNRPGDQSPAYDYARVGQLYLAMENPFINPNHNFIGWNTEQNGSGTLYTVGMSVTVSAHLSLYAQWTQNPQPTPTPTPQPTVTITYKKNAGDSTPDMIDIPVKGSPYTVRNNPFTRQGYNFIGWNTKPDGTGNAVKAGQQVNANGNNTLYAQWEQIIVKVTITYKANANDNQADVTDTVIKGNSYTIRDNPFTRKGYEFAGWNMQANGSGNAVNPGQVFTPNANQTVYATWNIIPPITDVPTGVDGRILPAYKAGDSSDWIEIARNGRYSLIVRKFSVNNVKFGASTAYATSNARKACNDFFNATNPAVSKQYEILPHNANLRNFTVMSNAFNKMGTGCADPASLYDGFSKPTDNRAIAGDDVCFCLSFCEYANFLSTAKFMRGKVGFTYTPANPYISIQPTPGLAANNFRKLHQSNQRIWGRNAGDVPKAVSCITYPGTVHWGTVFQEYYSDFSALVHPAAWVDGAVFN